MMRKEKVSIQFGYDLLVLILALFPFYAFSSPKTPQPLYPRYSLILVLNQHVCILLMSEPEQNQQAEAPQVDHHQAEGEAPAHSS